MQCFFMCFQVMMSEEGDESLITVSVEWSKPVEPKKAKTLLEKVLQTWFNSKKDQKPTDCLVLKNVGEKIFQLKIKPAPGAV